MPLQRNEAFRRVIKEVRQGPTTKKRLKETLELGDNTVKACLRRGVLLEIFKKLGHGQYAWIDYSDLEQQVKNALIKLKENYYDVPLDQIAKSVGVPPQQIQDLAYRLAPQLEMGIDPVSKERPTIAIELSKPELPQFQTVNIPDTYTIAPDTSEIRFLLQTKRGSMVHCTLPPQSISKAIRHKEVEEIWYCLQGRGEIWRQQHDRREVHTLKRGVCLTIPPKTHFQFRNTGTSALEFIIVTMPPWPGDSEAVQVKGHWEISLTS